MDGTRRSLQEEGPTDAGIGPIDTVADESVGEPGCNGFHTARDRRNERRFNFWLFGTMFAYLGATAAFRWPHAVPRAFAWLCAGFAWLLAIQAARSYMVFLRAADELLRRIQTEALALGFVAGAALSLLYPLLEPFGAPKLNANAIAVVMLLSWGAGSWLGTRRYSGAGTAKGSGSGGA